MAGKEFTSFRGQDGCLPATVVSGKVFGKNLRPLVAPHMVIIALATGLREKRNHLRHDEIVHAALADGYRGVMGKDRVNQGAVGLE
jgi:hypothetical protein